MLTLLGMPPVDHVHLAADLGCGSVSLGMSRLPLERFGSDMPRPYANWTLAGNPALRRDLKAAFQSTGVRFGLAEGFRIRPDADISLRAFDLDIMAELGAERVNAVSMETDIARTHDQLAILAEMVVARGMIFLVEFAPPNAIDTLAAALLAVEYVGRGLSRVMLDAMHFHRSGGTPADIAALDPDLIGYAQICDVPQKPLILPYIHEAMFARMYPGEGDLPLHDWITGLPTDITIGVEVPSLAAFIAGVSPTAHAARSVALSKSLLER